MKNFYLRHYIFNYLNRLYIKVMLVVKSTDDIISELDVPLSDFLFRNNGISKIRNWLKKELKKE